MLEINLMGGLGNQMFIYAFARSLQLQRYEVSLDVSSYKSHKYVIDIIDTGVTQTQLTSLRKLEILHFDTKIPLINYSEDLTKDTRISFAFMRKIKRRLKFFLHRKNLISIDDPSILDIIKSLNPSQKAILNGYFQDLAFFQKYSDEIRQDFQLQTPLSPKNQEFKEKILQTPNSCFLHVRRGDYLAQANQMFVKLDIDYYQEAIDILLSKVSDPHIFVFSNDIPWCKSCLIPKLQERFCDKIRFTFIEHNDEGDAVQEMELMRSCQNAIMANSSFSWWSAYLMENPSKLVIIPSCFLYGEDITSKLIPENNGKWMIIKVKENQGSL